MEKNTFLITDSNISPELIERISGLFSYNINYISHEDNHDLMRKYHNLNYTNTPSQKTNKHNNKILSNYNQPNREGITIKKQKTTTQLFNEENYLQQIITPLKKEYINKETRALTARINLNQSLIKYERYINEIPVQKNKIKELKEIQKEIKPPLISIEQDMGQNNEIITKNMEDIINQRIKLKALYEEEKRIHDNILKIPMNMGQQQNIIHQQKHKISKLEKENNELRKNIQSIKNKQKSLNKNLKTTKEYNKLKNSLSKKLLIPLPYLYIISKMKDIKLNIQLYQCLQSTTCFDIGYYLNNNEDISRKIWCHILTPELHYVCHGFEQKRLPNPKYKNNYSKQELIRKINERKIK